MHKQSSLVEEVVKQRKFGRDDVGCIGDGSFGHGHIRTRLADLCDYYRLPKMAEPLRKEMSDDCCEEDDAIALLNRVACHEGVHFTLRDGDLLLILDGDEEELED